LYLKNRIIIFFLFLYFVLSFIFFLPLSFHFLRISLFRFVLVDFVLLSLVSFHFVFISFRFVFVDFVSFRFRWFRFVSFLFRFALYRYPWVGHWNNSLWVDMLLHSHTLSWFRANQWLNPWSIACEASTLTITAQIGLIKLEK
jgi:hypothetical protein